jgi:hypothetical protein
MINLRRKETELLYILIKRYKSEINKMIIYQNEKKTKIKAFKGLLFNLLIIKSNRNKRLFNFK